MRQPPHLLAITILIVSGLIPPAEAGIAMLAGPAFLFFYYLIAWFWIGPEPKPRALLARYEPPDDISPAAARYIATGATDGRSFAAVIAQLAVRGCLRAESVNGKYILSRLMSDRTAESTLASEEKRILALLFKGGPTIEFRPAGDERTTAQMGRYITHVHEELTKRLGGKYFTRHSGIVAFGVFITCLFALPIAASAQGHDAAGSFMATFWILLCGLLVGLTIESAILSSFRAALRAKSGWKELFPGIWLVVASVGIIGHLLTKLAEGVSISFALMLVAFLLINLVWAPQLKRRSALGRQTADQIDGFRQFLSKVEQDRLDRIGTLADAPGDLARHLPYAIALEVKEAWGDHLTQTFLGTVVYTER